MSRRTFSAIVDGITYEVPTTLSVLSKAEQVSNTSLMDATANGKLGLLLQGVLAIALCDCDVSTPMIVLDSAFITAGEQCDFNEAQQNYIAFLTAMMPEVKSSKNAKTENALPGRKSSATVTASSS